MFKVLAIFFVNICLALAAGRTSAPSGALVVSKSATSGQYATIQKAINALSTTSTTAQVIFVKPGTYSEQVVIPSRKAALTIYGYTSDTSSYSGNQVTITHSLGLDGTTSDDMTGTVRAESQNFKMYNINVVNTRGQGSQALAISANAANQGYYGCSFKSYQDTVLAQEGNQIFAKSYIEGATDFIFGQDANAWFTGCDIRVLATSYGTITASGRKSSSASSYYVINNSTIAAASGNSVKAGAYYLGRPWSQYARVIFQDTSMTNVINAAGWHIWTTGDERTSNVVFEEADNTGAGASGTRASFAKKIGSPVSITTVLGSGYASGKYVDSAYLD